MAQIIDSTMHQYAIPLIVSLYDYWRNQRLRPRESYVPLQRSQGSSLQATRSIFRQSLHYLTKSPFRGVVAAGLVSIAGYAASSLTSGSQSTYVCPIILHGAAHLRTFRFINLLVDSALLIGVADLWRSDIENEEKRKQRTLISLGAGLLVSGCSSEYEPDPSNRPQQGIAVLWTIIAFFVRNSRPEHTGQPFLDGKFARSALGEALLAVILVLSAWQMVSSNLCGRA